jgi:FAD/FMN-containing dehydrogenase
MAVERIATTGGLPQSLDASVVETLARRLRGPLVRRGDDEYDAARKVWNGMIDKRPALIARCAGAADVVECVRFAREHEVRVSVRGGGTTTRASRCAKTAW